MDALPVHVVVAALGFVLGAVFGATVHCTNFCTMGSLSDIVLMGNWNRFRAWMLAIAVAVLGSQGLHMAGLIDLDQSIYLSPNLGWAGAIVGGLMFGFGMVMAGGCASKTLARLGAGNLKSLVVVLVLGVVAYMTLRGLIGVVRIQFETALNADLSAAGLSSQGLPDLVAAVSGLSTTAARLLLTAAAVAGLLLFCFAAPDFRRSHRDVAAGIVLGLVVAGGWAVTGIVGADDFEPTPLASFSFVAPTADSLMYLMTFTGATINFGVATVGGMIVGAFLAALGRHEFRIESFVDAADMLRHIAGAALMGVGGVLALGCTVGQGLSGVSTLAIGSVVALLAILSGGVLGLKYLEEGSLGGAVRALLVRT